MLDRVVTFAQGSLQLMKLRPGNIAGFVEGAGGGYGVGFGCVRRGVIEETSWGESPPTTGTKKISAARGLTWERIRSAAVRIGTAVFPAIVQNPFAACR